MLTILFFTAAAAASAQTSGSISGEREGSCAAARKCCDGQNTDCAVTHDVNFIRYTFLYFKNKIFFKSYFFSSNPCYCDHGCLDMGDCCPDFKQYCGGSLIFYSLLIHSFIHSFILYFILSSFHCLFILSWMWYSFIFSSIIHAKHLNSIIYSLLIHSKTFQLIHLFMAYLFKNSRLFILYLKCIGHSAFIKIDLSLNLSIKSV